MSDEQAQRVRDAIDNIALESVKAALKAYEQGEITLHECVETIHQDCE